MSPELVVVHEGIYYFVQDADAGTIYGKYTSRSEAEDALQNWKEYYAE